MELRKLYLKKESLRQKLEKLWELKDSRDWTPEERKDYDQHKSEAEKVNADLRLRSEFLETFKAEKSKEDLDFDKSKTDASIFKIIKSKIYEQTRDSAL